MHDRKGLYAFKAIGIKIKNEQYGHHSGIVQSNPTISAIRMTKLS